MSSGDCLGKGAEFYTFLHLTRKGFAAVLSKQSSSACHWCGRADTLVCRLCRARVSRLPG